MTQDPTVDGTDRCLSWLPLSGGSIVGQIKSPRETRKSHLKSIRAYLLKEDFDQFLHYKSPGWAARFVDDWCRRTMRSRLKPMKKIAQMLRTHRELLLNWFRARKMVALGAVEGFNNKAKVTCRKAYGFRNVDVMKIALYHTWESTGA
ncbi:transposase [Geomesophilobacter sediminis]|uniref:Transposase n=1 Tax=Geomesophilobacter sediminis TaxID=2798584 RepID=A0A8J7IPC8_9BACT|nr:transposase [Geomesophilobacter sediminis]